MTKKNLIIEDISDTAFWVAHYRAIESTQKQPLFNDPFASILSGEKGKNIAQKMPWSQYTEWVVRLRTVIIDVFIKTLIAEKKIDAVLNIGAGLDTRPYRFEKHLELTWIEVDYPKVITYKQEKLAQFKPNLHLESVGLDVSKQDVRQKLFYELSMRFKHILVLTEGVVPYLSNDQVHELGKDLFNCSTIDYWIVEYFTQDAIKRMKQKRLDHMKRAPFQFEPENWYAFFENLGWKPNHINYFGIESERLNQPSPLPFIFKMIQKFLSQEKKEVFQKFAGFAMLEAKRSGGIA